MGAMILAQTANAIDQAAKRSAFQHWFGLTPAICDMLVLLFDRGDEGANWHDIASFTSMPGEITTSAKWRTRIQARICRLREAMHTEAIDYELGRGYRLTEVGMTEARQALTMMAGSLVR